MRLSEARERARSRRAAVVQRDAFVSRRRHQRVPRAAHRRRRQLGAARRAKARCGAAAGGARVPERAAAVGRACERHQRRLRERKGQAGHAAAVAAPIARVRQRAVRPARVHLHLRGRTKDGACKSRRTPIGSRSTRAGRMPRTEKSVSEHATSASSPLRARAASAQPSQRKGSCMRCAAAAARPMCACKHAPGCYVQHIARVAGGVEGRDHRLRDSQPARRQNWSRSVSISAFDAARAASGACLATSNAPAGARPCPARARATSALAAAQADAASRTRACGRRGRPGLARRVGQLLLVIVRKAEVRHAAGAPFDDHRRTGRRPRGARRTRRARRSRAVPPLRRP